jgi:peroxiredoxin
MNKNNILLFALVICLAGLTLLAGCKKSTPAPEQPKEQPKEQLSDSNTQPQAVQQPQQTSQPPQAKAENPNSLKSVIARAVNWRPILAEFYGKEMPDFQLTDITGKSHSLKDYRGKTVMLVMWATWCQPCMQEVPHLNTLREIMPEDKLAILAISNESLAKVKKTAEIQKMKYTVIAAQQALPEPFNKSEFIPTIFYIRPDGTLKVVAESSSVLGEMKSIILAE